MRFLPWFATIALGVPALVALVLAIFQPQDATCWLKDVLGLIWLAALFLSLRRGRWRTRTVLALGTLGLLLLWPELGLRSVGFRHDARLEIQFGYPRPEQLIAMDSDPELFWKLPSKLEGINSAGFRGPELQIPKPAGTYRMVFFGDSCTGQGFPSMVALMLRRYLKDPRTFQSINLAVAGYSSYQGRVLAERWARKLEGDLGVVCFGWNDHWQAYGAPDEEKAVAAGSFDDLLSSLRRGSRLVQWLSSLNAAQASGPLAEPRVSIEMYRSNLESIGERIEEGGGRVLLMTAPSSHAVTGVPAHLVKLGFAADAHAVLREHRAYNEVVRSVAEDRRWLLLDLDRESQRFETPRQLFKDDGIHYSELGLRWVAATIASLVITSSLGLEVPPEIDQAYR